MPMLMDQKSSAMGFLTIQNKFAIIYDDQWGKCIVDTRKHSIKPCVIGDKCMLMADEYNARESGYILTKKIIAKTEEMVRCMSLPTDDPSCSANK